MGIAGQMADALYLANRPIAVNHRGSGLDMSGRTEPGLICMNGNIEVERCNLQFAFGAGDSLRILGTDNRRAVVGCSEGWPKADMIRGYLNWSNGGRRRSPCSRTRFRSMSMRLVAVGNQVELVDGSMPPAFFEKVDGDPFTIDRQPRAIKPWPPALNKAGTPFSPLKINDTQQVLAEIELACQQGGTPNAPRDARGHQVEMYLLTSNQGTDWRVPRWLVVAAHVPLHPTVNGDPLWLGDSVSAQDVQLRSSNQGTVFR